MKYRLYKNATNNIYERDKIRSFLSNRGIENPDTYLNLSINNTYDYHLLCNMDKAVDLFRKHFEVGDEIAILIDTDVDGYTSAAMTYLYIKQMDSHYPVKYIMHTKAKSHGLRGDVQIPEDVKLLIIPDGGTNDWKECKRISEKGIDVLILDHHEQEKEENKYAVVVNNQLSPDYPNKDFCGAGIVYKFLQALDEEYWQEFADDYLDLVALGNISDVMDMRSYETKYYVQKGLLNIKNKCFDALIKAQDYSISGKISIHNIQFYVTTIINGCIRYGTDEEKELLFRAFIEQDEFFEYNKRATKDKPAETIQESIYDRAARLSKNAKSRQDKARDKALAEILNIIGHNFDDKKVIFLDITNVTDSVLTGLIAIKIADQFNKPCILVNGTGGSARNFRHSPIESFKDVINQTGIFSGQGHANACGILGIKPDNHGAAIVKLDEILKDVEYDSTYLCDYIVDADELDVSLITDLSKTDDLIGQGVEEPMIAVENITLSKNDISVFGKNSDVISFVINDIKFVMFKCDEDNQLYSWVQDAWDDEDEITFTIVGKPGINEYEGVRTPQIIIENVNIISKTENYNSEEVEW